MNVKRRVVMEIPKQHKRFLILFMMFVVSILFVLGLLWRHYSREATSELFLNLVAAIAIGLFAMGSIVSYSLFKEYKNKDMPDCILEIYDDGWIRMKILEWYPDIPINGITKVWFGKKYIKKLEKWKIGFQIYFIYKDNGYVSNVCGGFLKEPMDIKEVEILAENLRKIAEKNKKEGKRPRGFYENWIYWQNSKEGKKIKEERDKLRKEAGIPVD